MTLTRLSEIVKFAAPMLGAAVFLAACGGGGGSSTSPPATGTLRLALVDAPACGYEHVHVTVEGVRVHQSATAGENDGGWVDLPLTTPLRVDLLTLTNGVLAELGQVSLPAGRYTQLRLRLADNAGTNPPANAVTPTGRSEVALDTPSAQQSGLKLNVDMDVPVGQVADFLVDFDACRSVVERGNSGRYNLKPVLRVVPRLSDAGARIVGRLSQDLVGANVITAQQNGVVVASTVTNATGDFVLSPLPTGNYTVVLGALHHAVGVVLDVPVVPETPTVLNHPAIPIQLNTSSTRTLEVGVTATPEPDTVNLQALQTLTLGPTIELLARPAGADGTRVMLPLPTQAPEVAHYDAAASAPAFAGGGAEVPARYRIRATVQTAGVATTKAADVQLPDSDIEPLTPLDFVFP